MTERQADPSRGAVRRIMGVVVSVLFKGLLPVGLLVAGGVGARHMLATPPSSQRKAVVRQATLVEVEPVRAGAAQVEVEAMGTVQPARRLQLKPQVSGQVVWMARSLEPGGYFAEGEKLLELDRRDYELAVVQRENDWKMAQAAVAEARRRLVEAEKQLKLEMGNQAVAEREYRLLGKEIDPANRDLVLRKPQLEAAKMEVEAARAGIESARAAVEAARARLEAAKLDLERTTVRAPFNAVVVKRFAELGDTVGEGTVLVELVGTDRFWVELSVPMSQLKWVDLPDAEGEGGSVVRLYDRASWGPGVWRPGRVIRRLPAVETAGRMARVLVAVADPFNRREGHERLPLLLAGSYVRAVIEGRRYEKVISIHRDRLHGDATVWVMLPDRTLDLRRVQVLYRGREQVLIGSGLREGEWLVTTPLYLPVQGMSLRVRDEAMAGVAVGDGGAEGGDRAVMAREQGGAGETAR